MKLLNETSIKGGKVLLFTLEYPPFKGGVANVYENIVEHWPSYAKASDGKPDSILVLNNNEDKLVNNNLPFLKWLPSISQLWKAVKKNKIGHILVGHILPLGTSAYILSKFTRVQYSVILHGMDLTFSFKKKRKKILAKKILAKAKNIICMNNYVAEIARETVGKKNYNKIKVVNPGIDNKFLTKEYESRGDLIKKYNLENKIVLFSVGRLVKRKGFDKVLECLPSVLTDVPDLVYVIAGAGPDEEYLKSISSNLNQDSAIFLGKITDEEKWAWLNLCDIFIMPSRNIDGDFEGFGIVFLEANLAGKPVIAGDSGGVSDAIENAINGLLVDPEDINDIAYAIIKLAKDENLRKKLGERGRERAINEFNWGRQVNKIYNIINK